MSDDWLYEWEYECSKKYPKIKCDEKEKSEIERNALAFKALKCPRDEAFPISLAKLKEFEKRPDVVLEYTNKYERDGRHYDKLRCETIEYLYQLLMPDLNGNFNLPVRDPVTREVFPPETINKIRHKMIRLYGKIRFWPSGLLAQHSVQSLLRLIFQLGADTDVEFDAIDVRPFFQELNIYYHRYSPLDDIDVQKYIYKQIEDDTERVNTCLFYIFDLACYYRREGRSIDNLKNAYLSAASLPPARFDLFPDFALSSPFKLPDLTKQAFDETEAYEINRFIRQSTRCKEYINPMMQDIKELLTWLGASTANSTIKIKLAIENEFITHFGLPRKLHDDMLKIAKKCGVYPIGLVEPYNDGKEIKESFTSFYPYVQVLPSVPIKLSNPIPPLPRDISAEWLLGHPEANAIVKKINTIARKFSKIMKSHHVIDDGLIFLLASSQKRVEYFCLVTNTPMPPDKMALLDSINDYNIYAFIDIFTACVPGQTTEVFVGAPLYIPGWPAVPRPDSSAINPADYHDEIFLRANEQTLGEFMGKKSATREQVAEIRHSSESMKRRFRYFFKTTLELARHLQSLEAKYHKQAHHMLLMPNYDQKLKATEILDMNRLDEMTKMAAEKYQFSIDGYGWKEKWEVSKSNHYYKIMCAYEH